MKKMLLLCSSFIASIAQANIGIDSMIKFTEQGKTSFVVTNASKQRQFIQVSIAALKIEKGEIIKIPYSRENIEQWRLSATPTRSVINAGLQKELSVQLLSKNAQETEQDQAFQLTIVPTPYNGKNKEQHQMQIAIGFAPIVIVPAKQDQPLQYEIAHQKNKLLLSNKGKTYFRATIDACPKKTRKKEMKECVKTVYSLSGRNLSVDLSEKFKNAPELTIKLSTHKDDFRKEMKIKAGQIKKA